MGSIILVINCGSSSFKFALIDIDKRVHVLTGLAERLGGANATIKIKYQGNKKVETIIAANHADVFRYLITYLDKQGLRSMVRAIGHRVVHGGEAFKHSALITDEVIKTIEACCHLAPLHNPANLTGIRAAITCFPNLPQVAVFDTAFHQTLPIETFLYAVPMQWYRQYGIRRYGFHGTSHRFVAEKAANMLNLSINDSAFISAHLGNGASATAILNGRSVDTTMGLTPLEGLVMGTRSGDVDPGLHEFIATAANMTIAQVNDALNKESGLLGLSELSNDCRELEEAAEQHHQGALIALQIFAFRLAKYIGALMISLPRIDALIFTGGIGENSVQVRADVLSHLKIFGFTIDEVANTQCTRGRAGIISKPGAITAVVINTDGELMIALDTIELVR